jgi:PEP-CTERM motif-containing protein
MSFRKKIASFAFLAVFLMVVSPAQADIIQTQTFGPQVPNFFPVTTFDKYTGYTSDITGIIVELSLTSVGGLAQVDNESVSVANVHVEFGTSGFMISGGPTLPTALTNPAVPVTTVTSADFVLQADDGDGAGVDTGGADYAELVGGNVTNSLIGNVLSANYAEYVGTVGSTFNITGVISTYLNVTGASGISQGSTPPTASGFVQVTYQLAPGSGVPEPGTMLLFASGLGSLGFWRLRRRRKKS